MARSLDLSTIAEGVESEEQRNILHLLRCDMGQGYLFSPAVPADDFDRIATDIASRMV
jgi:EAL domain-containing protein (putative c-di-GMP-specific phosphodiesterase class I)